MSVCCWRKISCYGHCTRWDVTISKSLVYFFPKSRNSFQHSTKDFSKVGKSTGGAKPQLGSLKEKPSRFYSQQWLNTSNRNTASLIIPGEYLQAVGWKKHPSTQQVALSPLSLARPSGSLTLQQNSLLLYEMARFSDIQYSHYKWNEGRERRERVRKGFTFS